MSESFNATVGGYVGILGVGLAAGMNTEYGATFSALTSASTGLSSLR